MNHWNSPPWIQQGNKQNSKEEYLYQDSVIQWFKILDVIGFKDANNVVILHNKMLLTVEIHLSTCIL